MNVKCYEDFFLNILLTFHFSFLFRHDMAFIVMDVIDKYHDLMDNKSGKFYNVIKWKCLSIA